MAHLGSSAQTYPLKWPTGTPRSRRPRRSSFGERTWLDGRDELLEELGRMGASNVVITTNIKLRVDGKPYTDQRMLIDHGVAVYFQLKGVQTCFPCDTFEALACNFRAITLTIANLRALERYGVGKSGQAFDGFKALPAVASEASEDPFDILGLPASASPDQIRDAHRTQLRAVHAEGGDTSSEMSRLNVARDVALRRAGQA